MELNQLLWKLIDLLVKVAQSYLTLCDPMDCSLPSSSVHGLSRQEYWSGLPFSSPEDLPDVGIKPRSPALPQILYQLSRWVADNADGLKTEVKEKKVMYGSWRVALEKE